MCGICNDPKHDDLNDDLSDIFGPLGEPIDTAAATAFAQIALSNATHEPARPATFTEPCKKCKGTGHFTSYAGRIVGNCFTCKGTGTQTFKTSPEARAKAQEAKRAALGAKIEAFIRDRADEWNWIITEAPKFDFARSMFDKLAKDGELSPGQLLAVQKMIARDQARAEAEADQKANAPVIAEASLDKIEKAFAHAIGRDIMHPKLRLDTFIFSPARTGKNAGSIYVKHATETNRDGDKRYLGKITEGKFLAAWGCTDEEKERIIAAAMDPEAAATAYGQREGRCSMCGRKLTKSESINRAMGPICADNFGW